MQSACLKRANRRHCSLSNGISSAHIHGTHVPVEEPFTASIADVTRRDDAGAYVADGSE